MDRLERYARDAAGNDEHPHTEIESYAISEPVEVSGAEIDAAHIIEATQQTCVTTPHEPLTSHQSDAGTDDADVPSAPTPVRKATVDEEEGPDLTTLRREVFSLTADMSAGQLTAIADPAVRAAGLLMADLLTLRDHDAAALTTLATGIEIPEAGRHGEMAVTLYREVLAIRSDAKRKAFEKKRPARIKALSGFGREGLLDEVARLRNLRA